MIEVEHFSLAHLTWTSWSIRLIFKAQVFNPIGEHDIVDALCLAGIPVNIVGSIFTGANQRLNLKKLLNNGVTKCLSPLERKQDVLCLLAAVNHHDLNLVLRLLLIHDSLHVPIVRNEHGTNLIKVVQVFALLDYLHNLVLLLLFLPLLLFLLEFELRDKTIGIPVIVNEQLANLFEIGLPVASLDHLNDLLLTLRLELLLLLLLSLDHVGNLVIVPVMLLQIHLGHVVVTVKVLRGKLEAHIIFSLLLLLLLQLLFSFLPLLFIENASKLLVHIIVFLFFLFLDLLFDDFLGLFLSLDPLIHLILSGFALWLDFLLNLRKVLLLIFSGHSGGLLLWNFHLQELRDKGEVNLLLIIPLRLLVCVVDGGYERALL